MDKTPLTNMDTFIEDICEKVSKIWSYETDAAAFENIAKKALEDYKKRKESRGRGKNFRVTDLSNPMLAYMDIKYPNTPVPADLQSKFNYGRSVERKVNAIFQKKSNYVPTQGHVEGKLVDLPNVRGRLDFRLGGAIVEFKTSVYDIESESSLLENNPQDIRQLLLYILFTQREHDEHRLLYLCGRYPNISVRSFRVKIKNRLEMIDYFKTTESKLSAAIKDSNPKGLGRCDYYNFGCRFKEAGLCDCSTEAKADVSIIKENVFLRLSNDELEKDLSDFNSLSNLTIKLWDVFTPRRWSLKESNIYNYIEQTDGSLEEFEVRKYIEDALEDNAILARTPLHIDYTLLNDSVMLFNDFDKQNKVSKVIPTIVRVYNERPKSALGPSPAQKAQLGLICALYGAKTGYLFVFYTFPKTGILYKIEYSDIERIKNDGIRIMKAMESSFQRKTSTEKLPRCPSFVVDKFECFTGCKCK